MWLSICSSIPPEAKQTEQTDHNMTSTAHVSNLRLCGSSNTPAMPTAHNSQRIRMESEIDRNALLLLKERTLVTYY